MASTKLAAYVEGINNGMTSVDAALAAGYSTSYSRKRAHELAAQARRAGLLPDPERIRKLVEAREKKIEEFMTKLADALPDVGTLIIQVASGTTKFTEGQEAAVQLLLDRAIGKPPVHIHGHKAESGDGPKGSARARVVVEFVYDDGGASGDV